jgi:tRNA dimethylallyltransferase
MNSTILRWMNSKILQESMMILTGAIRGIRRMTDMEKTLLVLAGPTAVGKTGCGIALALHFGTEIISADSRQIYLEPSIGTAVPSEQELKQVKHHFIRTIPLKERYHASRYEVEVLQLLEELFKSSNLVIMVGGSGLYIDAVCNGIDDLPPPDPTIRSSLHGELRDGTLDSLASRLKELDPISYQRIDLKNPMRVLKALEVTIQAGRPYSSFLTSGKKERYFRILRMALDREREDLYDCINRRVDRMMEEGLLKEAVELLPYRDLPSMRTPGYRELFSYLDGEVTLDEAVDLIKRNTRKLARKQLTWFRKEGRYNWFHPEAIREMVSWVEKRLVAEDH